MSCHFDLVEERLQRLENIVLGQTAGQTEGNELLDSLLSVSHKLASAVSKSEKVSTAMKKADDIHKFSDPLFAEPDPLVPEPVKFQVLLAEEEKMKDASASLQKIESLKSVLDSQAIQAVPSLQGRLGKVREVQASQQGEMAKLTQETYTLLENYKNIVQSLSETLAELDSSVSNLESTHKSKSK